MYTMLDGRGIDEGRLTDKQRLFVHEYLIDYNATRAACAAGYSQKTAQVMGAKLMKHPLVAAQLGKLQKSDLEKLELDRHQILTQLYYNVMRDPVDLVDEQGVFYDDINKIPPRMRACINGFKVKVFTDYETGNKTQEIEVKMTDKLGAMDLAMKHKGLFAAEKQDIRVGIFNLDELTNAAQASLVEDAVEDQITAIECQK